MNTNVEGRWEVDCVVLLLSVEGVVSMRHWIVKTNKKKARAKSNFLERKLFYQFP
jgi:hypothetical protein